jgi:hypothetical protein
MIICDTTDSPVKSITVSEELYLHYNIYALQPQIYQLFTFKYVRMHWKIQHMLNYK